MGSPEERPHLRLCDFQERPGGMECSRMFDTNDPRAWSAPIRPGLRPVDLCPRHAERVLNFFNVPGLHPSTRSNTPGRPKIVDRANPIASHFSSSVVTTRDVRAWLRSRGVDVADSGRIADVHFDDYTRHLSEQASRQGSR